MYHMYDLLMARASHASSINPLGARLAKAYVSEIIHIILPIARASQVSFINPL